MDKLIIATATTLFDIKQMTVEPCEQGLIFTINGESIIVNFVEVQRLTEYIKL